MGLLITTDLGVSIHDVLMTHELLQTRSTAEVTEAIMSSLHRNGWLKAELSNKELQGMEGHIYVVLQGPCHPKNTPEQGFI